MTSAVYDFLEKSPGLMGGQIVCGWFWNAIGFRWILMDFVLFNGIVTGEDFKPRWRIMRHNLCMIHHVSGQDRPRECKLLLLQAPSGWAVGCLCHSVLFEKLQTRFEMI